MPTYPVEVWPNDAVIKALDGGADDATGIPYIAKGVSPTSTPSYEVQYNRRAQRLLRELAAVNQGRVVDEGSLSIGVYPMTIRLGGAVISFDGATGQSVTDDTTTYVWLDGNGNLQTGSAFPTNPAAHVPLAVVDAASGVLTITDTRPRTLFGVDGGAGRRVASHTSSITVSTDDAGVVFTNRNATGTVTFALPSALQDGIVYSFVVMAAQTLEILPASTDKILYGGAADQKKVYASTIGHTLTLLGLPDGDWAVLGSQGSWSVEA